MQDSDNVVDVVVVGLGAMGSQALWQLAERGISVVGIDQFEPGHDRGASHGESRIIRTAYAEGADYVPLLRRAWRLWERLEDATGCSLIERTGGLVIGPASSATVYAPAISADAHHLKYELFSAGDLRDRFPQHAVDEDTGAFYELGAGLLRPEAAVLTAVGAARELGARVLTGVRVDEIVPDHSTPRVRLGDRELRAHHVVVAAGGWLSDLVPAAGQHVDVVRRVFGWFEAEDPREFAPDRFPVFIRTDATGARNWYGFPCLDGRTVKIGIHTWPGVDERVDPAEGVRPSDDADILMLAEVVAASLPGLRPRPLQAKACMYDNTADRHFIVGRRDDLPGLTVLGGFSGHGFKLAPVLGEIAAQSALNAPIIHKIDLFDPHRFEAAGS